MAPRAQTNSGQNNRIWGLGTSGVPTEAWGGAHPSSLPFLLPLSPSLPRQNQTPFPTSPAQPQPGPPSHAPPGWGCSPQHRWDTLHPWDEVSRDPTSRSGHWGLAGATLGLGTAWIWGCLEEGSPLGGGDLTWEVTPWIWGALADEGALQEGVEVLGAGWETSAGRWRENGAVSPHPNPASTGSPVGD